MSKERERLSEQLERLVQESLRLKDRMRSSNDTTILQRKLSELDSRMAPLRDRLAVLDDASSEAERQAARERDAAREKAAAEDASFWFKRFFTTLGIANAAGLIALGTAFVQDDASARTAALVADPINRFALGMVCAGLIPLALWLRSALPVRSPFRIALRLWKPDDILPLLRERVAPIRPLLVYLIFGLTLASMTLLLWGIMEVIGVVRGAAAA